LPTLLGALALLLTVKIGGLWQDVSLSMGTETQAQTQPNPAQPNPAQPAPAQTTQQAAAQPQPPAAGQPAVPPTPQPAAQQPATPQPATPPPAVPPAVAPPPAGSAPAAAAPAAGAPVPDASKDSAKAVDPFNYTDEEVDVLQQLAKRRAELDAKGRQLDERETLVTAAEARMDQKMAELKAMQSTLQDLLKQRSAAEEAQLQSLVKIYENMKPQAAAAVFEELDMDILLDVVSRMKERKVAPVLAQMTPTRAKELTFELAQRRQLPVAP
jgi:flagellar motility protein MotE (MotC chaperone)